MKQQNLLTRIFLLFALIVGSTNVWAVDPDLTLDFTSAWTAGEDEDSEKVFTKTISETTYTIKGQGGANFKFSGGYFIFGKSGAYIKLPVVDFAVEKIEVIGNGAGSTAVKMNMYVGETAVSTETTGCGEGKAGGKASTLEYAIAAGYETAGTQYILKVTSNHNAQITYVKYYKKAGGSTTVAAPSFSPIGGTYNTAQSVSISCATDAATIHYTITDNGDTPAEPTESDATYSGTPISVTISGTKIRAKAFKAEMTASTDVTATYTIKPNKPTISAAGATVTMSGDAGCTIYYTTDGTAPSSASTEYAAPFDLDANCTIKAIAYDTYDNSSDVVSVNYKYMPLNPKNINSGYYEKVTDASSLENGDAILIVNETAGKAMSTNQKDSNRGATAITLSDSKTYAPSVEVQKLVLIKKTEQISSVDTDVFYFYTGSGYLYASSNSSNQLKTEATPDDNNNARATITISSGDATVTFTGTNSHNLMQYNSSGDGLFNCYGSASQDPVQIYKEVAHNQSISTASGKTYATFVTPYALDFSAVSDDIKAYVAASTASAGSITFTGKDAVPAGTPLLIKTTSAGATVNVPVIASADAVGTNYLVAGDGGNVTYDASASHFYYILTNGEFKQANNSPVAVGKAYLALPSAATSNELTINFDDEAGDVTGIATVSSKKQNNGEYFNLNGQRVDASHKGIVIVNGKKFFNK